MTNDQTAMLARYGIDIEQARALMPDLRESHVAVLEALTNLEEWGLSTSMR